MSREELLNTLWGRIEDECKAIIDGTKFVAIEVQGALSVIPLHQLSADELHEALA